MSNTDNNITVIDIKQAIESEEFVLFYQPKVPMITG
jgi:EAL domain-containing protein (putative c-di-GMP-specific phosphodiesterase class I)